MAQDISDKIRAAAQARGVDPELAVRIAMAESSLDPSAKAKKSSAAGLFQVTDDTWKQYGGKPGKKLDADENIRVGLDIIASNTNNLRSVLGREPRPAEVYAAHYFGPTGAKLVLTAPTDQQIEQLLSKSAIKANPNLKGKTASQVLAQLETKVGTPTVSRETVAPPQVDPAQQQMERAFQSGISAQAPAAAPTPAVPRETTVAKADLSPSYQAALALSVLSDESEKEDRDPDNSPSISEQWLQQTASRPTALADLGETRIRSPFPAKPVMMNQGGEVKEPGLLSVPGYSETVAREMYPGEQGQFDRQDAARHMLAAGTLSRKYGPTAAEMLGNLHEITTSPFRWVGSKLGISQMPIDYEQDLHNNRVGIELAKRSRSQKELEDLIQQAAEAAKGSQMEGTAWIGRPQRPIKRAEGSPKGGETAEPTPEELEKASRPAFVTPKSGIGRKISATSGQINDAALQGLSEMPYNLVGSVADVGTLVLRPFGYQDKAPIMGSDWIKEQMTRLGVRPEPPKEPAARAVYEASQLASSLVNPTAPVRGAIAAGKAGSKAASEMLQDFQTYNRQLAVPGASYAVKPKGGEFTMERGPSWMRDEKNVVPRVDAVENYLLNEIRASDDSALTQWARDKLGRYMRRDMASPDDQFVKAADQGRSLHFMPDKSPAIPLQTEAEFLKYVRQSEGFNPKGEATTPYGRAVEMQVDMAVEPVRLEDFIGSERRLRPQAAAQIATDPERRVYDLMADEVNDRLRFPQLVETMRSIRENNTFKAYGQSIPIPKEFQFSDETLKGLSPAQASERVAAYNKWTDSARQKAASEAITKNPLIETVKAGEGNTWVRIPDTEQNPEVLGIVKDVGCSAGWCTEKSNYAIQYGSGENRLHILMDKEARPRVQLTFTERNPNPDEFLSSMDDVQFEAFKANYPSAARYGDVAGTPEYQEWLRRNPPGYRITEIKGFNNQEDLTDYPFLPFIQNYVKQLSREGNLDAVENLNGINMTSVDGLDIYNAVSGRYDPNGPVFFRDAIEDVRSQVVKRNDGSRYMVKDDAQRLLKEAVDDVFGPVKKAYGGMVERR